MYIFKRQEVALLHEDISWGICGLGILSLSVLAVFTFVLGEIL